MPADGPILKQPGLHGPDLDAVVLDLPGCPFHGLTIRNARFIGEVLPRALVEVTTVDSPARLHVFRQLVVAGEIVTVPFVHQFDLVLGDPDGANRHSSRILSPQLVTDFKIVEWPRWR